MNNKNRLVIIYLPNGNEAKYCTKEIGPVSTKAEEREYTKAEEIICDHEDVKIVVKEDGKIEGRSYVRMPYYLEMF